MSWEEFVLGGVGGAVVAGGIGTYTAIRIDRLNAQRDRRRTQDQERAVARLMSSELHSAQKAAEAALAQGQWPLWQQPMRHDAWDRHAHVLASRIAPDAFDQLARTYGELNDWQTRASLWLAQFPAALSMDLDGERQRERDSMEVLNQLRINLEVSHRELQPVAFPERRNVEWSDGTRAKRRRLSNRWRRLRGE
jgi:hypothetical protein